jgi:hypothetical protein
MPSQSYTADGAYVFPLAGKTNARLVEIRSKGASGQPRTSNPGHGGPTVDSREGHGFGGEPGGLADEGGFYLDPNNDAGLLEILGPGDYSLGPWEDTVLFEMVGGGGLAPGLAGGGSGAFIQGNIPPNTPVFVHVGSDAGSVSSAGYTTISDGDNYLVAGGGQDAVGNTPGAGGTVGTDLPWSTQDSPGIDGTAEVQIPGDGGGGGGFAGMAAAIPAIHLVGATSLGVSITSSSSIVTINGGEYDGANIEVLAGIGSSGGDISTVSLPWDVVTHRGGNGGIGDTDFGPGGGGGGAGSTEDGHDSEGISGGSVGIAGGGKGGEAIGDGFDGQDYGGGGKGEEVGEAAGAGARGLVLITYDLVSSTGRAANLFFLQG